MTDHKAEINFRLGRIYKSIKGFEKMSNIDMESIRENIVTFGYKTPFGTDYMKNTYFSEASTFGISFEDAVRYAVFKDEVIYKPDLKVLPPAPKGCAT